jgi:DNA-binding GntR family transcriptional regulator
MVSRDPAPVPLPRWAPRRRTYDNLKEAAAEYLRDSISSGQLSPGSRVDQDEVAATLGMSRVPVREAIIELAQKDYIEAVARRGAYVSHLGMSDVEDHFEIVALVFGVAMRRAVKRITPADLGDLRGLHAEITATADSIHGEELATRFLTLIARAGSSRRLDGILRFLGGSLAGGFYHQWDGWGPHEAQYREQLLDALEQRDTRLAVRLTESHFRSCATPTIALLRERRYWESDDDTS